MKIKKNKGHDLKPKTAQILNNILLNYGVLFYGIDISARIIICKTTARVHAVNRRIHENLQFDRKTI